MTVTGWLNSFLFLSVFKFIYLLRERESTPISGGGAEREREREKIPRRLWALSTEPDVELELMNHEIAT